MNQAMTEQDLNKEIEALSSIVRKIVTERARTPYIATCALVHALCIYLVASVNAGDEMEWNGSRL